MMGQMLAARQSAGGCAAVVSPAMYSQPCYDLTGVSSTALLLAGTQLLCS
jgi:hypothetical protein